MSNHLGQIYSTTKNAEKYIVLNSQNVELSGNVKLTNGNLDVSQNLIFNNFSVTDKINFRENSGSTSYNIINNSLTSNNDASFNNVDICGNLKVNTISPSTGDKLSLHTDPTTGTIEVKTAQMYPQTNNATLLGGANNRWSIGYFQNLNTNDCTGSLNPAYDAGAGSPNLSVGNGYPLRWFNMSCYSLYYGTGGQGSDDRIKHNEVDVSNGLDIIRQLTPKKYKKSLKMYDANYNGEIEGEWNWETGLIAQEILKIPDVSFSVKGGDRMVDGELKEESYYVDYSSIFSYNIAATKELDIIVQRQQTEIEELKNALNTLLSEAGKPTI